MHNRPGITVFGENNKVSDKNETTQKNLEYIFKVFGTAWNDSDGIWAKTGVILGGTVIVFFACILTMLIKLLETFVISIGVIAGVILGGYVAIAYVCPLFGLEIVPWLASFIPLL